MILVTLGDEADAANLVVWPDVIERHRRSVLSASMVGVRGQAQREGDVIHVVG